MPHYKKDFRNVALVNQMRDHEVTSRASLTPSNIPPATQEECKSEYIAEQEFNKHGLIDVILIQHSNGSKELISNVEVHTNHKNEILLSKLISTLKNIGFPLRNSMIFYLDPRSPSTFIYCGNDPLEKLIRYPIQQNGSRQITLKYRRPNDATYEETKPQIRRNVNSTRMNIEAPKRPKERKIKEVLEYVSKWRRLYQGYYDENGTHTQLPLEVAAQRVGISKKTLDDYLLQIRFGKKFGFNFQEHLNSKIGVLRTFVKKERLNEGSGRIYQRYDSVFIDSLVDIVNDQVPDTFSTTECPNNDEKMSVTYSESTVKIQTPDDEKCMMIPFNGEDLENYDMCVKDEYLPYYYGEMENEMENNFMSFDIDDNFEDFNLIEN